MLTLPPPEPASPRPVPRVSPTILEPARPETFNFRFSADEWGVSGGYMI
jgi:hypothetical protein